MKKSFQMEKNFTIEKFWVFDNGKKIKKSEKDLSVEHWYRKMFYNENIEIERNKTANELWVKRKSNKTAAYTKFTHQPGSCITISELCAFADNNMRWL